MCSYLPFYALLKQFPVHFQIYVTLINNKHKSILKSYLLINSNDFMALVIFNHTATAHKHITLNTTIVRLSVSMYLTLSGEIFNGEGAKWQTNMFTHSLGCTMHRSIACIAIHIIAINASPLCFLFAI